MKEKGRNGGRRGRGGRRDIKFNPQMTSWKIVTCLLVNFHGCQVLEKPVYVIQSVSALIPPPSSEP